MEYFENAYQKTKGIELGYSIDPDDFGGETYNGISRPNHPSWIGWIFIDNKKKLGVDTSSKEFELSLDNDPKLQEEVRLFYKQYFWDRFQGDKIPNQDIAEELFDTSVNTGIHRAVGFLQRALNLLNRNQKNYPDIIADGNIGPKTLETLDIFLRLEGSDARHLLKLMNALQGNHYIELMERYPKQEKFARGWLERA